MKISIQDESKEARSLKRLQKVFRTNDATSTVRAAIELAYKMVIEEETRKAAKAQSAHAYDESMLKAQGVE